MVNGSSQQKKNDVLFSSSIFYSIFSNAFKFEVNNLSPGVELWTGKLPGCTWGGGGGLIILFFLFYNVYAIEKQSLLIPPGATWYVEIHMFNPTPIKN